MSDCLGNRSPSPNPYGKCSEQISISLSEETLEILTTMARLQRVSRGELVRRIVHEALFGKWPAVQSLYDRLNPEGNADNSGRTP